MTVIEPIAPPLVAMYLVDLADCLCAELENSGGGATCWCGLYPGAQVSWEYCGECSGDVCGMGYVRLSGGFPYQVFPQAVIDERCQKPLAFAVEIGALRCIPQPASGEALDATAMTEVAVRQIFDARAIYTALRCCPGVSMAVGSYTPVGPQGTCVGGFWTAFLAVDALG